MGADEDGGVFLVKIDFGGLFLLGRSCSHRLILSAALSRNRGVFRGFSSALDLGKMAIFNYAVKYYGLKENPCHKAGSMGKKYADEMMFWTRQEFQTFIEVMKDRPASYAVFMTLYFTGIREGELLALTPSDIDFEKKTLTVNKSYQRLGREDIITTPKTPKSNRTIPIPDGLCTCLQEYMSHCYGLQKDDRLFPYTKSFLYHEMEYGCKTSGVKRIRVHDIRLVLEYK